MQFLKIDHHIKCTSGDEDSRRGVDSMDGAKTRSNCMDRYTDLTIFQHSDVALQASLQAFAAPEGLVSLV
jgi:hypothetical protein